MIEISSNGYSQQFVSDNRFVSDDPTKLPLHSQLGSPYYKYEVENTDQCFNLLPNCECKGNFVGSSDTNLLSDTIIYNSCDNKLLFNKRTTNSTFENLLFLVD
jgi:hypothetical protein